MKNHSSSILPDNTKQDPTLNGLVDLAKNLTKSPIGLLNLYCDRSEETYSSHPLHPDYRQLNQDMIQFTRSQKEEVIFLDTKKDPQLEFLKSGNITNLISLPLTHANGVLAGNLLLLSPALDEKDFDAYRNNLTIIREQILLVLKNKEQVRDYQVLLQKKEAIEERLKQEAKNKRRIFKKKSRLLAHVSHEIRTPLHGIIGLTEQLKDTPLNQEQKLIIDNLTKSERILMNLVNDVLDFSKLNSSGFNLQFNPAYVHEILREVRELYEPLAKEKGISLETDVNESSPVMADILRIKQVLSNMLNNALKFTPSGKITVRAKVIRQKDPIKLFHFEIEDTGIGVSEDFKGRIYQEYSQKEGKLKATGSGLGLAISKSIIKKFDGEYGLISPVNPDNHQQPGSIFWFTLPLKETDRTPDYSKKTIIHNMSGIKVLFIDDDPIVTMVGKNMLKKEGIKPFIANSGESALELLKEQNFDLIFSDVNLPGINGLQLTKKIRTDFQYQGPVVCVSAYQDEKSIYKAKKAGFTHFINKPFNQRTLKKLLARLEADSSHLIIDGNSPSPNSSFQ